MISYSQRMNDKTNSEDDTAMPYQFAQYKTIIIQPSWLQWLIVELPVILLTITCFAIAGLEDFPFPDLILAAAALLGLRLLYSFIYIRRMEYRIDSSQLVFEHGIFTRSSDYMELYRIVDFREKRNFMEQICGLKTIRIYSGDRTMPKLDIIGVPNRFDIVSKLRERVIYNRLRNGVYEITNR